MNYEIVAFIVYFLVVLAIGIIFFIKGKGTVPRMWMRVWTKLERISRRI